MLSPGLAIQTEQVPKISDRPRQISAFLSILDSWYTNNLWPEKDDPTTKPFIPRHHGMSKIRTYILILYLPLDTELTLDPLGTFELPAGFYAYVDEVADENLARRLKHHLSPIDTPKSHIDHLQQIAQVEEIWFSSGTTPRRDAWADLLAAVPGGISFIEGFGATQENEDTYLVYFDIRPMLEDFAVGVRRLYPDDIVFRAFTRQESELEDESDR